MLKPSFFLGQVMEVLNRISLLCFRTAITLINYLSDLSQYLLFVITFTVILLWLVGGKLKGFEKPELPLISPVARRLGSAMDLVGFIMVVVFSFYALSVFMIAELGFIFAPSYQALSSIDILKNGAIAIWAATRSICIPVILGGISSLCLSGFLIFRVIPNYERGEGLHDVKDIIKHFKTLTGFNPLQHIDIKKGCFIGLELNKTPLYIAWGKISKSHTQVLGASGTGKGIALSIISSQCVENGEAVIWIDPKFDRFSPRILSLAAKRAGKEYHFINLNLDQQPQFNILADASASEIEELLVAGFDLKGKGTDGDFHRGKDEDAAIKASKLAITQKIVSMPELIRECSKIESITSQENFWRKLFKLEDLNVIHTEHGVNLTNAIDKGSVIYIVGSTVNERVRMLQKMLLVRILQIITKQDRFAKKTITKCLVLDEFKHILSPAALTGLGVVRDFDTHLLLAHQSMGDLDSCPGISRTEAEGVVLDNTPIKIIYKLGDSTQAEKLSKNSGKCPVFVEQTSKSLDEDSLGKGSWGQTHVQLIDSDVLTHLPMSTDGKNQVSAGVLFGVDEARIFCVDHIPISDDFEMPVPVVAPRYVSKSGATFGDVI